ncbi:MAG: RNA-binding S4 domain-containing protein [Alphaproteobacteria bacterium]
MVEFGDGQRLDAWLWRARFFKTRSLAATVVAKGRVRVNGDRVAKASRQVRAGDVLTFPQGDAIRVVRVIDFAERRGPADEARLLYEAVEDDRPLSDA